MLGNGGDGTLFLFYFAGFQGFTDYRCFHVSKKAVTFKGVTKEVGVVFKRKSHIHFLHSFLFTYLGMQVLSSH